MIKRLKSEEIGDKGNGRREQILSLSTSVHVAHYSHNLCASENCPLLSIVRDVVLDERQSLHSHLELQLDMLG